MISLLLGRARAESRGGAACRLELWPLAVFGDPIDRYNIGDAGSSEVREATTAVRSNGVAQAPDVTARARTERQPSPPSREEIVRGAIASVAGKTVQRSPAKEKQCVVLLEETEVIIFINFSF